MKLLNTIKLGGVIPGQFPLDWLGNAFELARNRVSRARPSRSTVRIIACPHIVVDHVEYVRSQNANSIFLKSDINLPSNTLAGQRGNGG